MLTDGDGKELEVANTSAATSGHANVSLATSSNHLYLDLQQRSVYKQGMPQNFIRLLWLL